MKILVLSAAILISAALFTFVRPANSGSPYEAKTFGFNYVCDRQNFDGDSGFPGGRVRFNSENPGFATRIFLGNGTFFGQGDPNGWIQSWNKIEGETKGYLTLLNVNDSLGWSIYLVKGVIHHPYSKEVIVEFVDHQNEPCRSNNEIVTMQFYMA